MNFFNCFEPFFTLNRSGRHLYQLWFEKKVFPAQWIGEKKMKSRIYNKNTESQMENN